MPHKLYYSPSDMSKISKRRPCLATQRVIRAAECGENRISRYKCPEDCPFNPFSPAHYDAFGEIEFRAMQKATEWLATASPNRAQVISELGRRFDESDLDAFAYKTAAFYFERDANGRTCAERWAAAGFPTLTNDERIIQSAIMQMRIRLVEVHRVLDDLRVEVVDLLEPTPTERLVCDRSMASEACRFATLLGWFYPLPHFWRCFAIAIPVSPIGPYEPLEVAEEIVRHLGGPAAHDAWNDWFAHNLGKFAEALQATALARQEQLLANLDTELGKARYELRAPFETCRLMLDGVTSVAPDELADSERADFTEARVWFDDSDQAMVFSERTRPVLGRVLLGQTHWQLEAMGKEQFARIRSEFERVLGDNVRFQGASRDDVASRLTTEKAEYDPDLIPPKLLTHPDKVSVASNRVEVTGKSGKQLDVDDILADNDRLWLDQPVPAFDGKTPRQAALDPALRPKLIRILKDLVRTRDEMNLENGRSNDLNWMLEELGAHEIIFDPPPPRPRRRQTDDEFDDAPARPRRKLEPWPPLPPRPFTQKEAAQRLMVGSETFETARQALEAIHAAGGFVIEDIYELLGNVLTDTQLSFLGTLLAHAWFAFVPPGCYGPRIDFADIQRAFLQQLESIDRARKSGKQSPAHYLLAEGPQPAIVKALGGFALSNWKDISPNEGKENDNLLLTLIIIKTFVELLDAKCRRSGPHISQRGPAPTE